MNVLATLSPPLRLNLLMLFTAGLLFWSALAALLPTLPLYVEETGANSTLIGIVMGSFAIGLLSSRSWLAQLADQRGRKLVMLIGMAVVAIAPLGYLTTTSIPLLITIRAFHGLSIAAFVLAYSALVVDLSPPHYRGELVGYMSVVNPIGMAMGPMIGGFLHEWAGYGPAFGAATVMGLVGLGFTAQVQESYAIDTSATADLQSDDSALTFWRTLGNPRVRIPALVLLLIGLAFGTLITFVPLFIQEAEVSLNVGLFYTAAAIASFLIRLIAGRASDRYGRGPFITLSLVLYTLAMTVLRVAHSPSAFLIAAVLEGTGAGLLIPMMAALMADRSRVNERGRIFSLCMVGFDVGIAIAGPILGAIAVYTDYRTMFGLCAGLSLMGVLIFLTLSSRTVIHSFKFALGRELDLYAVEKSH